MLRYTVKNTLFLLSASLFISACGKSSSTPSLGGGGPNSPQSGGTVSQNPASCDPTAPFSVGDGSVGNPYLISLPCDVLHFTVSPTTWNSSFKLSNNLDLKGFVFTVGINFAGTFDGNGKGIFNLTSNAPLFYTNKGTISNLALSNVTFDFVGGSRYGGMVGENEASGVVSGCSVAGTILDSHYGGYFIGSLVGYNYGKVTNSFTNVALNANAFVGGLVGYNAGQVAASYTAGTVTGLATAAGQGAGGLVGVNGAGATIANSYSLAAVSAAIDAGGLVGSNFGSITNSFAAGRVTGTTSAGGLVGSNSAGTFANSYWDTVTSGQSVSALGTAKLTSDLQNQATFVGWDFASVWVAPAGTYPVLR